MAQFDRDVSKTSLSKRNLVLEITEECVVGRGTDEVPDTLAFMRQKGFPISLDDFGTGYASLTHLKTLPVDELKIDRSFISDLSNDLSDRSIVMAMLNLAESLGLSVVAEGIENQEQHNTLLAMGCSNGQGYLHGRPMDMKTATQYLRSSKTGPSDIEPKAGPSEPIPFDRKRRLAQNT